MKKDEISVNGGVPIQSDDDAMCAFFENIPVRERGQLEWGEIKCRDGEVYVFEYEVGGMGLFYKDLRFDQLEMYPEPLIEFFMSRKDLFLRSIARATEREWYLLELALVHYDVCQQFLKSEYIIEWAKGVVFTFKKSYYIDVQDNGHVFVDICHDDDTQIEKNLARAACEILLAAALNNDVYIDFDIQKGVGGIMKQLNYDHARFAAAKLIYTLQRSAQHNFFIMHEIWDVYAKHILTSFIEDASVGSIARATLRRTREADIE